MFLLLNHFRFINVRICNHTPHINGTVAVTLEIKLDKPNNSGGKCKPKECAKVHYLKLAQVTLALGAERLEDS